MLSDPVRIRLLQRWLVLAGGLVVAVVLRAQYFEFVSSDYYFFLSKWVLFIREHGIGSAYGTRFNNYAPLYGYMLGLAETLLPGLYPLYSVKLLSFAGEAFMCWWGWRIACLLRPASLLPEVTLVALLLCPSVVTNASITAQCDAWLAGLVLACLHSLMAGRQRASLVYASLAFCMKPQAIFFAPMLLVLLARRDISWKWLWLMPATYVALCVPAWMQGRTLSDMLLIYWIQVRGYRASYSAANPYLFFNGYYPMSDVIHAGEWIAASVAGALVAITLRHWKSAITPLNTLVIALLFAAVMPYCLPLMHDRYFFMADVLSLMLACARPCWAVLPLLFQTASLMAPPPSQLARLPGLAGTLQSLPLEAGVALNGIAIALVLVLCYHELWKKRAP